MSTASSTYHNAANFDERNDEVEPLLEIIDSKKDSNIGNAKAVRMPYVEHKMTLQDLDAQYRCNINLNDPQESSGLDYKRIEEMRKEYGSNVINPPPSIPLWYIFLSQFGNLFMVLLMSASFLCFCLWLYNPSDHSNLFLAVFLFIVVVSKSM